MIRRSHLVLIGAAIASVAAWGVADSTPKRLAEIASGRIYRGAWQSPAALRSLINQKHIRTIVTLTAINADDPKYVNQRRVIETTGVDWIIIPMRGSTATLEQLDQAAALVADPARQPVFFHCVGGHHRSNLVHAAYRIRHDSMSAAAAWDEICRLPWTNPRRDQSDREVIDAFAMRGVIHQTRRTVISAQYGTTE